MSIRFFEIKEDRAEMVHQYLAHSHPIKNVDHNQGELFLSTDNHMIAVCNLPRKQIIRTLYPDQLQPEKSLFQSA